jgi:hypothetical protein
VRRALGLLLGVAACGSEDELPPPPPDPGCEADQIAAGPGVCIQPGVPPAGCANGFEPRDHGCDPILPAGPCTPGTMALPGETACREVAPCPADPFGELPDEPGIQHVSAAFRGTSDGSAASPWRTIQEGVAAAGAGAIVAVGDGEYAENVSITGKPIRLWGRCPASVLVRGIGGTPLALFVGTGSSGSEVRGLAITGARAGFGVSGAENVVFDAVWVHDTPEPGAAIQNLFGPTSVTVRGSLVEHAGFYGFYVTGTAITVEDSVVRDITPSPDPSTGMGMFLRGESSGGLPSTADIHGVVVERTHEAGIAFAGSNGTVTGSLVRDVIAMSGTGDGYGISSRLELDLTPSTVTVSSVVVERSARTGLFAGGSTMIVEATVVRDSVPTPDSTNAYGWGMTASALGGRRASLTVARSLVERPTEAAILFFGADGKVEETIVRDVLPVAGAGRGLGVNFQRDATSSERTVGELGSSLIERAGEHSLLVVDSDVAVTNSVLRDTAPSALDGLFGDGAAVVAYPPVLASLVVTGSRVERNARAGTAAFRAHAEVGTSIYECNAFDLDSEGDATFIDLGGNTCGCNGETAPCAIRSSGLEPPEPL